MPDSDISKGQDASLPTSSSAPSQEGSQKPPNGSWTKPLETKPREPTRDEKGNLQFFELHVRVTGGHPGKPLSSTRLLGHFDKKAANQVHTLCTKTTNTHQLFFFSESDRNHFHEKHEKMGEFTLHMEAYPPMNNPDFKPAPTVISTKFRLMAVPPTLPMDTIERHLKEKLDGYIDNSASYETFTSNRAVRNGNITLYVSRIRVGVPFKYLRIAEHDLLLVNPSAPVPCLTLSSEDPTPEGPPEEPTIPTTVTSATPANPATSAKPETALAVSTPKQPQTSENSNSTAPNQNQPRKEKDKDKDKDKQKEKENEKEKKKENPMPHDEDRMIDDDGWQTVGKGGRTAPSSRPSNSLQVPTHQKRQQDRRDAVFSDMDPTTLRSTRRRNSTGEHNTVQSHTSKQQQQQQFITRWTKPGTTSGPQTSATPLNAPEPFGSS